MVDGCSRRGSRGTLQTRRSPSILCTASISVFGFAEEPCQARPVIGDGVRVDVNVLSIVNVGCSAAMRSDPLRYLKQVSFEDSFAADGTYPIANVKQSAEGAIDVMGSKIVRADMCSLVDGSNKIMLPCSLPNAILPLRIKAATLIVSYAENRATSPPVRMSHTIAVLPAS